MHQPPTPSARVAQRLAACAVVLLLLSAATPVEAKGGKGGPAQPTYRYFFEANQDLPGPGQHSHRASATTPTALQSAHALVYQGYVGTASHHWRTPTVPTPLSGATVNVTLWADTWAVPDALGSQVDPYQALANGTHGMKALLYQGWLRQSVDLVYKPGTGTVTDAGVLGAQFQATFTQVSTDLIHSDLTVMVWPSQYGMVMDVLHAAQGTPSCIAVNQAGC